MKNVIRIGLIMSCLTFIIVNVPITLTATTSPFVGWGCAGVYTDFDLSTATAIAAGYNHSMVLKADGTVVAWGWYRTRYNTSIQAYVPAGLDSVVAIAAGYEHSMALKGDGTVVAWGDNSFGQTDVPADLTDVVALAGGRFHSVALKSDGTVVVWGCHCSPYNKP